LLEQAGWEDGAVLLDASVRSPFAPQNDWALDMLPSTVHISEAELLDLNQGNNVRAT
jgi:hypothetical protein